MAERKSATKKSSTKKSTASAKKVEQPVTEALQETIVDDLERDPGWQNKVQAITKENYKDVAARAQALKTEMHHWDNEHGTETTFASPSLNYLKARYNMSLKAISRHRKNVMSERGKSAFEIHTLKDLSIPRKKREKAETTIEEQPVALDQ